MHHPRPLDPRRDHGRNPGQRDDRLGPSGGRSRAGAEPELSRIRQFRDADASALAVVHHAAVHGIARLHYSQAQVDAWTPAVPDPATFVAWAAPPRLVLVAVDAGDRPLAYGDLEPDGHIDQLYCHPDAAGTGVAATLYAELEAAARLRGISRLHAEASEPARRFFLKRGFSVVERNDFELAGVPIHNFRMEKALEK